MLTAFYTPLKPSKEINSGDRRSTSRFMRDALARAGHAVDVVSSFSSYDDHGDAEHQAALRDKGVALAQQLVREWRGGKRGALPQMWVTHHVYYKAPDWLGPRVSAELGIPYVIAEASHAPKRTGGSWAIGHDAAAEAIRRADLVLCQTGQDAVYLEPLVYDRHRVVRLPVFLDPTPFRAALKLRAEYRQSIGETLGADPGVVWILVAETMRTGDPHASYQMLIKSLAGLLDLPWRLLVAGDGPQRSSIEAEIERDLPGRACFLGRISAPELAALHAAADMYVWPAINETYGRSLYEAQAAGTAVVSCALHGVPDSVTDGHAGVRSAQGDAVALTQAVRALILDPARRNTMGRNAMIFIEEERSVAAIATRLDRVLASVIDRSSHFSQSSRKT